VPAGRPGRRDCLILAEGQVFNLEAEYLGAVFLGFHHADDGLEGTQIGKAAFISDLIGRPCFYLHGVKGSF